MMVNNTAPGNLNLPSGGEIYVEFLLCITTALGCKSGLWNPNISNSTYNITGCRFERNQASAGEFDVAYHLYDSGCENQFLFGRGGGLAVFFKYSARDNLNRKGDMPHQIHLQMLDFSQNDNQ